MKNPVRLPFLLLLLVLIFELQCTEKEGFAPHYMVPEKFKVLIDTFLYEGTLRGHSYELTNLIIRYDSTLEANICGICNSTSVNEPIQKIISINPTSTCLESYEQWEALVFHELGHCLLGRNHLNDTLPNGDPKSLMVEANQDVYSSCQYPLGDRPCDFRYKRSYYLDELFDSKTPEPDWAW